MIIIDISKSMTANEALDAYLKSLSPAERVAKSRDICALCDVSYQVLYNWRKGYTPIGKLQRREISKIIGADIFTDIEE